MWHGNKLQEWNLLTDSLGAQFRGISTRNNVVHRSTYECNQRASSLLSCLTDIPFDPIQSCSRTPSAHQPDILEYCNAAPQHNTYFWEWNFRWHSRFYSLEKDSYGDFTYKSVLQLIGHYCADSQSVVVKQAPAESSNSRLSHLGHSNKVRSQRSLRLLETARIKNLAASRHWPGGFWAVAFTLWWATPVKFCGVIQFNLIIFMQNKVSPFSLAHAYSLFLSSKCD